MTVIEVERFHVTSSKQNDAASLQAFVRDDSATVQFHEQLASDDDVDIPHEKRRCCYSKCSALSHARLRSRARRTVLLRHARLTRASPWAWLDSNHRRECAKHRENATAANQRAAEASTSEFPKAKYPAQEEAKKENEIANQHADAAHTVDKIVVAEGGQQPAADPACE